MPFTSTILCVDDDEDDLLFIRQVISAQDHAFLIEEANNGWEAMSFLQEALARDLLPCLVIMDMNMPRMDGRETIHRMKEHEQLARIPIVVFTTYSQAADKRYFESRGIHFITKPFHYKDFTRQIIELLSFCADLKG